MLKTLLTKSELGGGDFCRMSLQYFLSFSRQKSAKANNMVYSLVLAPTCKLKTVTFAALSPYQRLVFLRFGSDSAIVEGLLIAFIPAKWLTALLNTCTISFLGIEMKEAMLAISAISYKCGSSVLTNELFKIYQVKMWLWVIKWMKIILVVSIDEMWCLRGLGHVSKRTLYQNVCCSPLYQMLRKKNVILKNLGVGKIHYR